MQVVPAGHPKHLQNQAEPFGFIPHTAWRLHPPTRDKREWVFRSLLGFVPHAEPGSAQQGLTMERMTKAGKKPMMM